MLFLPLRLLVMLFLLIFHISDTCFNRQNDPFVMFSRLSFILCVDREQKLDEEKRLGGHSRCGWCYEQPWNQRTDGHTGGYWWYTVISMFIQHNFIFTLCTIQSFSLKITKSISLQGAQWWIFHCKEMNFLLGSFVFHMNILKSK